MWKQTTTALIALTALAAGAQARPSDHHDVAAATIGGLITGVVLSELIDDGNVRVHLAGRSGDSWYRYHSDFRDYDRSNRYHRSDRYGRHDRYDRYGRYDRYDRYDRKGRDGYYGWETRKVWVPGYWDYTRDRCGRSVKIWVKGHYQTQRVKVWVSRSSSRHHRPDPYCR